MTDFHNMKNCTNSADIAQKQRNKRRHSPGVRKTLLSMKDGFCNFVTNIALYELAKDIFTHISDKVSAVTGLMNDQGDQEQTRQSIFDDPEDDFYREDYDNDFDNDYDDIYEE